MENKTSKTSDLTMLQLMEILSEKSDDSQLGEEFWNDNGDAANELARRLSIQSGCWAFGKAVNDTRHRRN